MRAACALPEAAAARKAAFLAALRRERSTSTPRQHRKAESSASAAINPMPSGVPVLTTALNLARAPPGSAGGSGVGKSARDVASALRVLVVVLQAVAEAALLLLALPEGGGELLGALDALAAREDAELSDARVLVAEAKAAGGEAVRVCRGPEGVGMAVRLTGSSAGGGGGSGANAAEEAVPELEALAGTVASAEDVAEVVAVAVVQEVGEAEALGVGTSDCCCNALALGDGVADKSADKVTAALEVAVG